MHIDMFYIVIIGSIVSLLGTMIGASLGAAVKNPSNKLLGFIIGFAGGVMLSVVVFDLIPEATSKWSLSYTILFVILGVIIIAIVDDKININNSNRHIRTAFMASLGLMLHNFPEGIIVGCGFAAGSTLGIKMSIIITIHDIPEGIAVAAPLVASKVKNSKILFYAFITAFPTAIGTFTGAYIANISPDVLGMCLSIASGIMLYVICGEMIPESSKLWEGITSTLGTLSGIILGLVIVQIL
ncbi:ZIP family metal transporter [Clostridium kluyveri]|uniref:ZIP family metal transporter n=1 Tax=Clostridium kluyveri TaxID=1534 RepID=A0A1L5FDH9_CLOKL|nr:ZIP family metal transporter [Clostridium kluyveri]APM41013.1 ZIP family metal transporter [Clostridium kluyveri]UZQ48707.1 ZIP family metal transporter [Clostridium kluyveri]